MKKIALILTMCCLVMLSGFTPKPEIKSCFLSFNKASGLKMNPSEHEFPVNEYSRKVLTEHGDVNIGIVDNYLVLYHNKKGMPFVTLEVGLYNPESYDADKRNVLENMKFMNDHSRGMDSKNLLELNYNGYKIYGLSSDSIESGDILGSFVMFPGDNTIVHFSFHNQKPGYRNFENLDDYKSVRNAFIGEYTDYLKGCK